jgi:stearoyl-CoA desaturase (delta-9 desaturase)
MLSLSAYCLFYYALAGLAVPVAYHRVVAHRSAALPRWLERAFMTLGLPAGTPIQWAGNHRFHHAHADRPGDPHSPVLDGFWHAHCGWYLGVRRHPVVCALYALAGPLRTLYDGWHRPRSNREHDRLAPDVAADAYYRWVSRPWPFLLACWTHTAFFFGLAWLGWGLPGVLALWVTLIVVYNLGDAIDSMAHLIGQRPYQTPHQARNHWFLGLFTLGEGWHANHHEFPASARHGLLPGQPDVTFAVLRTLERVGLAKDLRVPPPEEISARLVGRGTS